MFYESPREMNFPDYGCILTIVYNGLSKDEVGCASFEDEWLDSNWEVVSVSSNSADISVKKSGTYNIEIKESTIQSKVFSNLYLLVSLVIICVIKMPLWFTWTRTLYIECDNLLSKQ